MSDKMLEEFEVWAASVGFTLKQNAWGNDYAIGYGWEQWQAWKASRAAMVKDGWQIVPRIPTNEMKKAFHQADSDWEDGYAFDDKGNRHDSPVYQWIAMLNAAPKP